MYDSWEWTGNGRATVSGDDELEQRNGMDWVRCITIIGVNGTE
jgi:hypothetical protein